jgi:general stress protein 26
MSVDIKDKAEVEKRLWLEIEQNRAGMLGAMGPAGQHFAPMTAFAEPETGKIWFFTSLDTELAQAAEAGTAAVFILMAKNQTLQACVRGQLRTGLDPLHRDKYWSPVVSAWFPKGKNDSSLTLLCLTCDDAEIWLSEEGPIKFGLEIAKANLTRATPDLGSHVTLALR